jgi:hypothetical protein
VSALCHQKQIFSVTIKCPPGRTRRRLASGSVLRDEELDRPAIMSELFPTKLRCLGIGAWYNLTVALFGGTAPLVIQWLGGIGHSSWFFWYVSIGAVVASATTLPLPETKGLVRK